MRTRFLKVSVMAMALVMVLASAAFAEPTPSDNVGTAISDGASSVTALVTDNLVTILGVTVVFLFIKFGRRLIKSFG